MAQTETLEEPSLEDLVNEEYNRERNRDPLGNQWGIVHIKGTSLYKIIQENAKRSGTKVPVELEGKFTKPTIAETAIDAFLEKMWAKGRKPAK